MTARKQKIDPFKVKKTNDKNGKMDSIKPGELIVEAIDNYRKASQKAKQYEAEASLFKEAITKFTRRKYTQRVMNEGKFSNFKVSGNESIATYIIQDSSSDLSQEDLEDISAEFGEEATEELTCKNLASLRFNPEVLEHHYEQIQKALQKLPNYILEDLFKPMALKAVPNAVEKASHIARNEDELRRLIELLKIKNYIR